jgi:hypothetical protein
MAGAAAGARFTGCNRYDVALGPGCKGDLSLALHHCLQAGLSLGQTELVIDRALDEACKVFDDARYWRAVLALADKLPAEGTMSGAERSCALSRPHCVSQTTELGLGGGRNGDSRMMGIIMMTWPSVPHESESSPGVPRQHELFWF